MLTDAPASVSDDITADLDARVTRLLEGDATALEPNLLDAAVGMAARAGALGHCRVAHRVFPRALAARSLGVRHRPIPPPRSGRAGRDPTA